MSSFIFPVITFPYVARVLSPLGTGRVNFATSVISYFSIFAQLGVPTYGVRICAQMRDDRDKLTKTAHELIFINFVANIIVYISLAISLIVVPRFREDRVLLIIISVTIFLGTVGMEWLYKALEQYKYITIRSVVFKFIALVAMFMLVHEQKDYVIYGGITIFASSASNILNLFHANKYIDFKPKPLSYYNCIRHLKPVIIFFAMSCAATIYTNLDNVMLGFMKTDVDVGYYGAAVKIKTILVSVVTSLGAVVLPRASFYIEHKKLDAFQNICRKALNFVFLVSIPMTVYFIMFAYQGIILLSGLAYKESVLPMQIIMPTLVFIGLSNILGIQILVPTGREKIVLYSEVAGAVVDIIVNSFLIPVMASSGAAIGTLVAELVVLIIQYCYLKNEVAGIFKEIHYLDIFIAVFLSALASVWVKFLGLGCFLTLVLSSILFFGVYVIFLLIKKEEIAVEVFELVVSKSKKIFKKQI